jgi:hypothetical protein
MGLSFMFIRKYFLFVTKIPEEYNFLYMLLLKKDPENAFKSHMLCSFVLVTR